jgi:hypothetical protein
MFVYSLTQGLCGIKPLEDRNSVKVRQFVYGDWNELGIRNIRYGHGVLHAKFSRTTRNQIVAKVHNASHARMPVELGFVVKNPKSEKVRENEPENVAGFEVSRLGKDYVEILMNIEIDENQTNRVTFDLCNLH